MAVSVLPKRFTVGSCDLLKSICNVFNSEPNNSHVMSRHACNVCMHVRKIKVQQGQRHALVKGVTQGHYPYMQPRAMHYVLHTYQANQEEVGITFMTTISTFAVLCLVAPINTAQE